MLKLPGLNIAPPLAMAAPVIPKTVTTTATSEEKDENNLKFLVFT